MNKFKEWGLPILIALTCLASLFCFKQANASDLSVYLGGASYHVGATEYTHKGVTREINQNNPMLGVQYKQVVVFGMKNSYHRTSIGVAWAPEYEITPWLAVGARLGIVSGYEDTPVDKQIAPVINPYIDLSIEGYHMQWGIMPSATGDSKGIITLNLKYDIPF